jgi:hypothetical protein
MKSTSAPAAAVQPAPAQAGTPGELPSVRSLPGEIVRGWDRFWFSKMDPTTLCFIRIFCGLLTFYIHLTYSWDLFSYVGPEAWMDHDMARFIQRDVPIYGPGSGWEDKLRFKFTDRALDSLKRSDVPAAVLEKVETLKNREWATREDCQTELARILSDEEYQDYRTVLLRAASDTSVTQGNYYWSIYYHVTDPTWIVILHVTFLVCMLLFTAGFATRFTGAITWLGAMCYVQRASVTVFGQDTMMMILLLYLLIGPAGATLSVDRWLAKWWARRRGLPEPEVKPSYLANFAIRLIQVHMCLIYLAGGTSKLLGSTWWSGTSLNLVLLNYSFAPLDWTPYYRVMKFLASHRWLWETFTTTGIVGTMFVELGFPFLVWDRRWRWVMICAAVMLHTGIAVFMGLTCFSMMMIVMVSSFIPPEVIARLTTGLSDRVSRLLSSNRSAAPSREGQLVLSR